MERLSCRRGPRAGTTPFWAIVGKAQRLFWPRHEAEATGRPILEGPRSRLALAEATTRWLHWHVAHAGEYGPAEVVDVEPLDGARARDAARLWARGEPAVAGEDFHDGAVIGGARILRRCSSGRTLPASQR